MAVKATILGPCARRRRSADREKTVAVPKDRFQKLLRNAPKAEPGFLHPRKCKPVNAVPKAEWIVELKLDAFRALAVKAGSKNCKSKVPNPVLEERQRRRR